MTGRTMQAPGEAAAAAGTGYDAGMDRDLFRDAETRALRYLQGLPDRPVAPSQKAVAALARFDEPLPAGPGDPRETLRLLDEVGSPATMAMAGPRFFGFVIGGALPVTVAAQWLAAAWDQNAGRQDATPSASRLELVALRWLVELLGLPAGTGGAFVTGASVANLAGLAAARHALLERAGWPVEERGLFGAPEIQVIVGAEAHPTMIKALGLLGLGRRRVREVPVDDQGRMRADALPVIEGPAIVCLQAGNVNTGAFDPAEEIVARARDAGAWVHVDGAFGLWAAASPAKRPLTAGHLDADSWATDAHKWLNVPYDCGLAFVRSPESLRQAMSVHASYLPVGDVRDPADFTPELSRRARGVEVWAALRTLGQAGVADLVDRLCARAGQFADGFRGAGYPVHNDVVLNQVLVSFGDAARTDRVIRGVQEEGTCWCGGADWQGRRVMRVSVSSWATTEADVERSLRAILGVARGVV